MPPQAKRIANTLRCVVDEGSSELRRLQQAVALAQQQASEAKNAEARLRTMVRVANDNASDMNSRKDLAERLLEDAVEEAKDLRAELEATRELAAQDIAALHETIEELTLKLQEAADISWKPVPKFESSSVVVVLEAEVANLSRELNASRVAVRKAEDLICDLRSELQATKALAAEEQALLRAEYDQLIEEASNLQPVPMWVGTDEEATQRMKALETQVS